MDSGLVTALVGVGGTLLGTVAGYLLDQRTTGRTEARRDARESREREDREQAAARLVVDELMACQRTIETALAENGWDVEYELPTEAWASHSHVLVLAMQPAEFASVSLAYRQVRELERSTDELLRLYKPPVGFNDPGPMPTPSLEQVLDHVMAAVDATKYYV